MLAKQVIVATGSKARHLPNLPVDQKIVMDNEGALNQESVPKKLAIIGAGVIGLEMGSVWRRVGSEVTILEAMPDFLAAADVDVAKEALKLFTKQGLNIQMGVKIGDIKATKKGVSIAYDRQGWQGTEAGCRSPDRLHRPCAEYGWPECRRRWPQAGRPWNG